MSGLKAGGCQFATPPSTGETSAPGMIASFAGFGFGDPLSRTWLAQFDVAP